MSVHFELQTAESELQSLANEYWQTADDRDKQRERAAFEAGASVRYGEYTLQNLETIVRWKSERAVLVLISNSEEKIRKALAVAAIPETPLKDAVAALTALRGIDLPLASAILTAIFPERYTVMDYRDLDTLGQPRHDIAFYEQYLEFCRQLAGHASLQPQQDLPAPTPLRSLERALWQWSKIHTGNGN